MNLENIEEKIQLLYDDLFQFNKVGKRIKFIKGQLDLLYNDLAFHRKKMQKEHEDVIKLEKISVLSLFQQILGNAKEQLEKERQEYLQAVLEYNSISKEIDLMKYELELLQNKRKDANEIKNQLDYYLKVKEQKILFHNKVDTKKIREINRDIDQLHTLNRELKEAKEIALTLDKLIRKAFRKLNKIKTFESSRINLAGKYASFEIKSNIDNALKEISTINFYLTKLDKELSDVYSQYTFFSINKYQKFVESFYDHLITDYVLKSKLKNAINCLQSADNQIKRILATLNNDLEKTQTSLNSKIETKREIVRKI